MNKIKMHHVTLDFTTTNVIRGNNLRVMNLIRKLILLVWWYNGLLKSKKPYHTI